MRRGAFIGFVFALIGWIFGSTCLAVAACTLPFTLTNGQTADATQVMANFNALVACLNAAAPGGSTNAIQYNAGSGTLCGAGPLTDGQVVIGATGGAPQAAPLTAGPGITITNSAGGITIATTGGPVGTGLDRQVMSATPTAAGTGLTNWLNQGSATVSDSAVGISINAPSSGNTTNLTARFMPAPTPPYTITALIASTRNTSLYSEVGIGWYDGTNKLHVLSYFVNGGGPPSIFEIEKWNSPTSYLGNEFKSALNDFLQPIWLRIRDDGTNVSFSYSQDGANFLQFFSTPKATGWLGAAGYNNLVFFTNPQGGQTLATLLSWAQN